MTNHPRLEAITDDGAIALCRAIVAQADGDLLKWQKHGDSAFIKIADLKRFYRGTLFSAISGDVDPDWYISVLNRNARAKKAYVRSVAERRRMNAAANL